MKQKAKSPVEKSAKPGKYTGKMLAKPLKAAKVKAQKTK